MMPEPTTLEEALELLVVLRIVVTVAVAVMIAGGLALWRIPDECKCQRCQYHVEERAAAKMHEQNRLLAEQKKSHDYNHPGEYAWPSCQQCQFYGRPERPPDQK